MNHKITINTYENNTLLFKETTTGILDEDYLTFSTDTDSIRLNLDKFNFTKENNETILKINLQECTLFLKELKQHMNIPLEFINYTNNKDNIIIEYKLISQEYPLKIEIMIGEINNEI